jgi:type II secretory pathway component PulK
MKKKEPKKEGSILIIALWSICLLSTLAVILGFGVRQKLILVKRLEERDKTYFLTEAAVKRAIIEIKKESENSYHALSQGWSNNSSAFKGIVMGDGKFDVSYEIIGGQDKTAPTTGYGMIDEESKININKADPATLIRLFHLAGLEDAAAQDLAFSVIDWRDSDSELSVPTGSAENSYYRNLAYPYEAKNGDFEVLEELLLVKEVTSDVFQKVKNYITIYGSGKVNINTACEAVFLALGLSRDTAEKIISYRNGKDGLAASADDNIFRNPFELVERLSQLYRLSDPELAELESISEKTVVKSEHFFIRASAKLNHVKFASQLNCVINSSGRILYCAES